MRYHKLDLNLLVALDALLEESSVSRAADRVFITQSAMSNALGRLRRHFGDDLIVQVGRRMVLTERAQALRAEVRAILMRIQQVTRPADSFEPGTAQRVFRVAASDYFSMVVLPPLLQYLGAQAPQVGLDVMPLGARLSDELERGDVDLLIVPRLYAVKNYPVQVLFEDPWVCVTWSRNTLPGRKLTLARFLAMEHVAKRENHPSFPPLEEWELDRQKISRKVAIRVPQYGLLPLAVIGTQRVATVQSQVAGLYRRWRLPLSIHRCPFACPPLEESMQWHPVRESDAGHAWLREAIATVCLALPRA
ncbi:MAG: LysR family transcriptional regulator [Burkholderiaceae bacterium]|nr:LysR family transcriptional regulator [Burkholderiaceae bacterium]